MFPLFPLVPLFWFVVVTRLVRHRWAGAGAGASADALLARRYANGEIDDEEFLARRAVLRTRVGRRSL